MEDIVSVELAKKLQKKGFPLRQVAVQDGSPIFFDLPMDHPEWHQCDAWYLPTIAQALKWLREEMKIHIATGYSAFSLWRYVVMYLDERAVAEPVVSSRKKESHGAAIIAGIEYVLDNLI